MIVLVLLCGCVVCYLGLVVWLFRLWLLFEVVGWALFRGLGVWDDVLVLLLGWLCWWFVFVLEWDFWNLIARLFGWVDLLCLGGLLFVVCRNYVLLVLWFSNFGDFVGLFEFCVCVDLVFCLLRVSFVVLMIWQFLSRVCFGIWLNLAFGLVCGYLGCVWLFRCFEEFVY